MLDDPSTTLQLLLDRHATGDPAARELVFRHCLERLRVLTRRMLRRYPNVHRWEETSDVFQNVLIRLDRALRELQPATTRDFLCLAAAHIRWELLDLARQHAGQVGVSPTPPDQADAGRSPPDVAAEREFHARIAELPEEDRAIFDLLLYHGMTQPEAAAVLGVALRTLKRRWQAVRVQLAERYGDFLS